MKPRAIPGRPLDRPAALAWFAGFASTTAGAHRGCKIVEISARYPLPRRAMKQEARMLPSRNVSDVAGQVFSVAKFPAHTLSAAVTQESNQRTLLVAIERLYGFLQPPLGRLLIVRGEWIVDPRRPSFFFERGQDRLLIGGWHLELLDHDRTDLQL